MSDSKHCPVTGEIHCKCLYPRDKNIVLLPVDLKSTLRKLFTDHAVYTALVMKSIVDHGKDTEILVNRLLSNQKDIGDQLRSILGDNKANTITFLLTEHVKLAGDVMKAASEKDKSLDDKIRKLFANGDQIAAALSIVNYKIIQPMFHIHNQFVIDMTLARAQGRYSQEQELYDGYYTEILAMSDAIATGLM